MTNALTRRGPAAAAEWIGGRLTGGIRRMGHFTAFAGRTAFEIVRPPWRGRLVAEQCWRLGLRSMPVAMLTALFVGMVILLQTGYELRTFNAKQYAAAGAGTALTRIMIPIFTALVVGARMAASIAAELGTMRVTEQIDAMQVLDVDPHRYLVAPRVAAAVMMLPLITVYADLIGLAGGLAMGAVALQISPRYYLTMTLQYLTVGDFVSGLVKTFFFGAAMGLCGCYFGFHARGGAEGVGRATTRAVVVTLMSLIVLEYILSTWILYLMEAWGHAVGA